MFKNLNLRNGNGNENWWQKNIGGLDGEVRQNTNRFFWQKKNNFGDLYIIQICTFKNGLLRHLEIFLFFLLNFFFFLFKSQIVFLHLLGRTDPLLPPLDQVWVKPERGRFNKKIIQLVNLFVKKKKTRLILRGIEKMISRNTAISFDTYLRLWNR